VLETASAFAGTTAAAGAGVGGAGAGGAGAGGARLSAVEAVSRGAATGDDDADENDPLVAARKIMDKYK
jgi:hypothetical protein